MKLPFLVFSAVVLSCLVSDGNCGVVSDVYGNVRNKTVAIKDGVTGWLSHGRDWILGSNEKPSIAKARSGDDIEGDDGMFSKVYNSLLNGFVSARDNAFGFFVSDEKRQNNGFISSMYDKVKNRITKITVYVVGDDEIEKPKEDDLGEIRRALNTMINKQKERQGENLYEGAVVLEDNIESTRDGLQDGVDKVRGRVDEVTKFTGDHISGGLKAAGDIVTQGVNDANERFSSTIDHMQQSGIEISEKEREVLNAISNRIHEKISKAQDAVADPKLLSYPEEEKKDK